MTEIKLQGKPIEKLTNEVIKGLPEVGMFQCEYNCAAEKVKLDVRRAMGVKYYEWDVN